jgi:hypothetical protein
MVDRRSNHLELEGMSIDTYPRICQIPTIIATMTEVVIAIAIDISDLRILRLLLPHERIVPTTLAVQIQ